MGYLIAAIVVVAILTIILLVQDRRHGRARSGNIPGNRDKRMLNQRVNMRTQRHIPGSSQRTYGYLNRDNDKH